MDSYDLKQICREVKGLIVESLDLENDDFALSSNLVRDLSAESIDFLDIVFRIEQRYRIKIERGKIERTLRERFSDAAVKPNAEATVEIKAALKELLPEVAPVQIDRIAKIKEVPSLFTVATFVRFTVSSLLEANPSASVIGDGIDGFGALQLGVAA
jgi:acyl carrier protein